MRYFLLLLLFLNFAAAAQHTASENVFTFDLKAPQLDTIRKIWVWLPKDYETSEKKYPVLYMHDAQNLFDAKTSYAGEWKVDETLDSLDDPKVIVVGIEHGNEQRLSELTPYPNEEYGGGEADRYLNFLRKNLKPYIDSTFRTLPDAANTGIMGSSLGGLVSFYAAVKYPETFGSAGIFSPSFWYSDKIYSLTENASLGTSSRFYFMAGTDEDEGLVRDVQRMVALLEEKGVPKENLKMKIVEGGQHNEADWSKEFPEAFHWLYPPATQLLFQIQKD